MQLQLSHFVGVPALYMIVIVPVGFLVSTGEHTYYLLYNEKKLVA